MKRCIENVPQLWRHILPLSAVPKDGTPYVDNFELALEAPVSYLGQQYTPKSPVDVNLLVYRAEGRLLADIAVKADMSVPCARCLEPAGIAINGNLRYLFSLRPDEPEHDKDACGGSSDGDEDVILLDTWEDEIDMSPMIWEVFLTSLPMTVLCKPDCKGLCPHCGTNLNKSVCSCPKDADPRMEILRDFIKNDDGGLHK